MSFNLALFVVSITPLFLGGIYRAINPGCLLAEKLYRIGCLRCMQPNISGHYMECGNDNKWVHKTCRERVRRIKCVQIAECDIQCLDMSVCSDGGGKWYPERCARCLLPGQRREFKICGRTEDWYDSACLVENPICCQRSECVVKCIKSEPPSPRPSCSYTIP